MTTETTFYPGQPVYVAPSGHGTFGNTRIKSGLNKMTGKPFEPILTIGYPAVVNGTVMVNTDLGPFPLHLVTPAP